MRVADVGGVEFEEAVGRPLPGGGDKGGGAVRGDGDELVHQVYQHILIATAIDKKHTAHMITCPEAPLNLKPKPSNSTGPSVCLRNTTSAKATITAPGKPAIAAKWSRNSIGNGRDH
jgi:hypothetical protein